MENSRPTCFVLLEVPLTVTFSVVNEDEDDPMHWNKAYFEDQPHDMDSVTAINMCNSAIVPSQDPAPVSDHAIVNRIPTDALDMTDRGLYVRKDMKDLADQILLGGSSLNYEMTEEAHMHHAAEEHDSSFPVLDHQTVSHRSSCLGNGVLFCGHSVDVEESASDLCRSSRKTEPSSVDTGESLVFPVSEVIPDTRRCSQYEDVQEASIVSDLQLTLDGIAGADSLKASGEVFEHQGCSLTEISDTADEDILPLSKHDDVTLNSVTLTTTDNVNISLKKERIQLDLGYFTEDGNEGNKDGEDGSDLPQPGDSVSERLHEVSGLCNDFGCDELHELHAVRKESSRPPRTSILKHSKTSSSFDYHMSHCLTLQKETWTDYYHLLSNAVSSRSVVFLEHSVPIGQWSCSTDSDSSTSLAMDRLREIANHLHLPVNLDNWKDFLKEPYSKPSAGQLWKSEDHTDASEAEKSRLRLAISNGNVTELFDEIKQDLLQIQEDDETIARQLLTLYNDIRQYKYMCNCQLYRDMMEAAIDNEDKKDELSRHHVDTIPERLCTTLKQWGLTRINLQRRRFSIF